MTVPSARTDLTAEVVVAYVANNRVQRSELPGLIARVHTALVGLSPPVAPTEPAIVKPTQPEIGASIRRSGLKSFIDGKRYITLWRHLRKHGLDPQSYRARFGLPADYPMICASYSEQRSSIAKARWLAQKGQTVPGWHAAD